MIGGGAMGEFEAYDGGPLGVAVRCAAYGGGESFKEPMVVAANQSMQRGWQS